MPTKGRRADLDARVKKLEDGFADMRTVLAGMDEKLNALAAKDDLVKMAGVEAA